MAGAGLGVLADAYAEFLLAGACAGVGGAGPASGERLTAVLSQAYPTECELLRRYWAVGARWAPVPADAGPWAGRRCWVGVRPPGDAQPGDLWFDVVEVALAVFVSTAAGRDLDPPDGTSAPWRAWATQEAWVSLRPAAVWQVSGYCRVVGRNLPSSLADSLSCPVSCGFASGSTFPDAEATAVFFGKNTCDFWVWSAVSATLSPDEFSDMWPGEAPEFGGGVNSGVYVVLGREDAWWPDVEALDDTRPENPRVVCDGEAVPGVRFRTAAMLSDGEALFSAADADGLPVFDREAVGEL